MKKQGSPSKRTANSATKLKGGKAVPQDESDEVIDINEIKLIEEAQN